MIQAISRAAVFVCAIEKHVLRAQYNVWQDRTIHMFTDFLLKILVNCTVSALVWLTPGLEAKSSARLKSLMLLDR